MLLGWLRHWHSVMFASTDGDADCWMSGDVPQRGKRGIGRTFDLCGYRVGTVEYSCNSGSDGKNWGDNEVKFSKQLVQLILVMFGAVQRECFSLSR